MLLLLPQPGRALLSCYNPLGPTEMPFIDGRVKAGQGCGEADAIFFPNLG